MIIELPKRFSYSQDKYNYAKVRDDTLLIKGTIHFEKLMYNLTYAIKGKKNCYYCGKQNNGITIDHMFPIGYGGISITNNLLPACSSCNSNKGNLNFQEYKIFKTLAKSEKKKFREEVYSENEEKRYRKGFNIPKKWVKTIHISRILVRVFFDKSLYKGKKYSKYTNFIKKYGKLPRPIVVSSNFILLDGFNILACAKEQGMENIPVVILENVEVI